MTGRSEFKGCGYRIVGDAEVLDVSLLPWRKRPQLLLCHEKESYAETLAYFASEEAAQKFMAFVDRLIEAARK